MIRSIRFQPNLQLFCLRRVRAFHMYFNIIFTWSYILPTYISYSCIIYTPWLYLFLINSIYSASGKLVVWGQAVWMCNSECGQVSCQLLLLNSKQFSSMGFVIENLCKLDMRRCMWSLQLPWGAAIPVGGNHGSCSRCMEWPPGCWTGRWEVGTREAEPGEGVHGGGCCPAFPGCLHAPIGWSLWGQRATPGAGPGGRSVRPAPDLTLTMDMTSGRLQIKTDDGQATRQQATAPTVAVVDMCYDALQPFLTLAAINCGLDGFDHLLWPAPLHTLLVELGQPGAPPRSTVQHPSQNMQLEAVILATSDKRVSCDVSSCP